MGGQSVHSIPSSSCLGPCITLDLDRGKRRLERLKMKVLEGRLQENKGVRGFRDDSWQQSVA